jgi:hypothetical protein
MVSTGYFPAFGSGVILQYLGKERETHVIALNVLQIT